jgi:hypothetical protein
VGALGVILVRTKVARGKFFGPTAASAFLTVGWRGAVGVVWGQHDTAEPGEGHRCSVGGAFGRQRHVGGGRGRVARAHAASTKQGRGGLLTSEPDATAGFKSGQPSQKSFKRN